MNIKGAPVFLLLAISVVILAILYIGFLLLKEVLADSRSAKNQKTIKSVHRNRPALPAARPVRQSAVHEVLDVSIPGDGGYSFDVVGTRHYQGAISSLVGQQRGDRDFSLHEALIVHQPHNAHDKNACAVFVQNHLVGYLARGDAAEQVTARKSQGFHLRTMAKVFTGRNGEYQVKLDYSRADIPASTMDREMLRFLGESVPRGLTKRDALRMENRLRAEKGERFEAWEEFRSAAEYLQSTEGREDYEIKKPSLKQLRTAFDEAAKGLDAGDYPDECALLDKLLELYPEIERS